MTAATAPPTFEPIDIGFQVITNAASFLLQMAATWPVWFWLLLAIAVAMKLAPRVWRRGAGW